MLKESIFGVSVCSSEMIDLLSKIKNNIDNKKKAFIVAINPEKIILAKENTEFREVLNSAEYQIPDGVGVIVASKFNEKKIKKRITGIDLMDELCKLANENRYKVFLYGSKQENIENVKLNIKKKYSDLKLVGTSHGYIKNEKQLIKKINIAKPDILFVALGSPKQENWICNNMNKINAYVFQGVGGSFDVLSGKIKRSPKLFSKLGLEWLYRLIANPSRIKRQIRMLKFLMLIIKKEKN